MHEKQDANVRSLVSISTLIYVTRSLNLALTGSSNLAAHWSPRTCLSLPPCPAFCVSVRNLDSVYNSSSVGSLLTELLSSPDIKFGRTSIPRLLIFTVCPWEHYCSSTKVKFAPQGSCFCYTVSASLTSMNTQRLFIQVFSTGTPKCPQQWFFSHLHSSEVGGRSSVVPIVFLLILLCPHHPFHPPSPPHQGADSLQTRIFSSWHLW